MTCSAANEEINFALIHTSNFGVNNFCSTFIPPPALATPLIYLKSASFILLVRELSADVSTLQFMSVDARYGLHILSPPVFISRKKKRCIGSAHGINVGYISIRLYVRVKENLIKYYFFSMLEKHVFKVLHEFETTTKQTFSGVRPTENEYKT